jgi:pantothenate kinase
MDPIDRPDAAAPGSDDRTQAERGVADLVAQIAQDARGRRRYVFGLTGPPGSGKSTVAAQLADALGAVVVPMDGFHLDNTELERRGLLDVKGAPETFDAAGFVQLVEQLRHAAGPVSAPAFDRVADRTVDAAITVGSDDHVVIVEGNYLLLDRPPWASLTDLFDLTGYIDIDDATRVERLVARHVRHGRTPADAREFVCTSDEANAAIIATSRSRADVIIDPSSPPHGSERQLGAAYEDAWVVWADEGDADVWDRSTADGL